MGEVFRRTRLALVEQDAAGSLKAPSSADDFLSGQEDLSFSGAFENIENLEL